MPKTWKELETLVQSVLPNATIGTDNYGQVIVYTEKFVPAENNRSNFNELELLDEMDEEYGI